MQFPAVDKESQPDFTHSFFGHDFLQHSSGSLPPDDDAYATHPKLNKVPAAIKIIFFIICFLITELN